MIIYLLIYFVPNPFLDKEKLIYTRYAFRRVPRSSAGGGRALQGFCTFGAANQAWPGWKRLCNSPSEPNGSPVPPAGTERLCNSPSEPNGSPLPPQAPGPNGSPVPRRHRPPAPPLRGWGSWYAAKRVGFNGRGRRSWRRIHRSRRRPPGGWCSWSRGRP